SIFSVPLDDRSGDFSWVQIPTKPSRHQSESQKHWPPCEIFAKVAANLIWRIQVVAPLFRWNAPGKAAWGLAIDEEGAAGRHLRLIGQCKPIGIEPTLIQSRVGVVEVCCH